MINDSQRRSIMKLLKRYLAQQRRISNVDDENVLLKHLFNNTWAVHMSEYGFAKVSVELHDGKRFCGETWTVSDVRKLYRRVLAYMRTKGWRP